MNLCVLTGNIGADPELFYASDGNQITSFNLAFRNSKEKSGWIRVVCFNKSAEIASKYLHKGAKVTVSGHLDQNRWEGEDGKQRSSIQLIAREIDFIKTDGRGFDEREGEQEA